MSRLTLVATLLVVLASSVVAQDSTVTLTVTPDRAPIGQTIRITLHNGATATIIMPNPAPWGIHNPAGNLVYSPKAAPSTFWLPPGKSHSWFWDQKDLSSRQVAAGSYEARLFFVFNPGYPIPSIRMPFSVGRTATITSAGQVSPGSTVSLRAHAPDFVRRTYRMGLSFGKAPGIPIGAGRTVPLNPDPLLVASLTVGPPLFVDFAGQLDGNGRATAKLGIPNLPQLRGIRFFAAFVVLHLAAPNGIAEASPAIPLTVQ